MKVTETERRTLVELYTNAKTTPVIKLTSDPLEKDLATQAWDEVGRYMRHLGSKYNIDFTNQEWAVDPTSGEIVKV